MKRNNKNGKILVNNIVMLFLVLSVLGIFLNFSSAKEEMPLIEYEVSSNDTLWNISANICKKSDKENLNVQNVIKEIKKINNLQSSNIYEGQTLNLPVY